MKVEEFYCTNNIHVRTIRFSILCTPADRSDETQLMFSTILLCFFVSKYDINGSRLDYSTMSSNKFKYINMYIICKDKAWLVLLSKHLYTWDWESVCMKRHFCGFTHSCPPTFYNKIAPMIVYSDFDLDQPLVYCKNRTIGFRYFNSLI